MGGAWGTLITLNLMSWTRVLFSFVEWSIQLWYQPREGGRGGEVSWDLPKREELRLELLVLEPVPHLRVAFFDFGHQPVHQSVDAHLALVQRFDEVVANLRHQTSEAEERVRFGVLCEKKKKKKRKKRTNEWAITVTRREPLPVPHRWAPYLANRSWRRWRTNNKWARRSRSCPGRNSGRDSAWRKWTESSRLPPSAPPDPNWGQRSLPGPSWQWTIPARYQ